MCGTQNPSRFYEQVDNAMSSSADRARPFVDERLETLGQLKSFLSVMVSVENS